MKIGFYGGTFNPIHNGHIAAAKAAKEQLGLDKLVLIPDQIPPHKTLPAGSASTEQRYAMTELACDALGSWSEVSNIELNREGPSYTSVTMTELAKLYPEDELWFLMGSDMFLSFHHWHEPETICKYTHIAAFSRLTEDENQTFEEQKAFLEENYQAKIQLIDNRNVIELSSTEVRESIAKGEGSNLVPEAVYGYIIRCQLYGSSRSLYELTPDELRPIALSYLKVKRMPHVLGTEQEAVRLAKKYGVDETKARIAALLHDCTKKLDLEQQLELCSIYWIDIDEMEKETLKLLHSRTGAVIAREIFHVDEEVEDAIRWHTTGKPNMNLLEKIIYLADYIEPTRDFPGVDKLRDTVYKDIDQGLLLGLSMTVKEMEGYGTPVHHNTLDAKEYLISKGIYI